MLVVKFGALPMFQYYTRSNEPIEKYNLLLQVKRRKKHYSFCTSQAKHDEALYHDEDL